MAVALLSKDVEVHASAVMVVLDTYPRMMIAVIDNNWPPKQVLKLTRNDQSFMQKITPLQRNMISTLDVTGYNNLDVSCIYNLIRHFKLLPVPNQGWGNKPLKGDTKEEDDVERIRTYRNDILHRPRCGLSEQDGKHFFQESCDMAKCLDIGLGSPMNGFESQIKAIRCFSVDRKKYIEALENCAEYQARLQKTQDTPNVDLYYGNDIMMKFGSTDNQDASGDSRCSIYIRDQSLDVNAVIQNIDDIKKTLETGHYNVIKLDGAVIGSLILHISIRNTCFVTNETLHDSLKSFLHHFFLIAGIQCKTGHVFILVLAESDSYTTENDVQDIEYLPENSFPILKLDVNVPNSAFQNENVLYKEVNRFITGMYNAIDSNGVPINGSQREVMMLTGPENDVKRQLKEPDTDEQPEVSSYKLNSQQTVDLIGQKFVTNLNLESDDEMAKENRLAKRKIDKSCIKVREEDAETQSDSGHIELNSPLIENVKKEKAMEVCRTPEQMRNILASGTDDISKDMNIDDHWRKLIMELCRGQIVRNVVPSSLLTSLGPIFSSDEKRSILSLERQDSTKRAMDKLLEMIDQKDYQGKWQIFKQALIDNEYEWFNDSIEHDFTSYEDTHAWEYLLSLFEKKLSEMICPLEILQHLREKSIISEKDSLDVYQICRKYGENAATLQLLTYLPKRKPKVWYPEFMKILYENGYECLVQEIDPEQYENLNAQSSALPDSMDVHKTPEPTEIVITNTEYDTQENYMPGAQDVNLDDHWRKLIMELCREPIVKNVRPSGLLAHLGPIFSWDEKSSIRSIERMESPQNAMEKLLEKLDQKEYEGKWQIFKQALIEDGYEWVNEFIEGDYVSYQDTRGWGNLIHVFEKTLSEQIRPQEILPLLRAQSIISEKDAEEVYQMYGNHGEKEAVFQLLTHLPNRKPNTWFPEFMEILYESGYVHIVEQVDPDMYEKLQARSFVKYDKLDDDETVNYSEGDRNYKEYDRKENCMSEQPQASSYNLTSSRTVGVVRPQPVTNFNLDHDDIKITKEKHFANQKVDESYNKLSEEDLKSQTDTGHLEVDSLFVENVKRNIAMKVWPEVISNKLGSPGNYDQDSDTDDEIVKEELRLRGYQMELAKPALDHTNCIIVAPAGSGKTYVALKIIQDHMEKTIDRFPKVVFLVEQSALAKQQADSCKKYLSKFRVKLITGEIQRDSKIQKSLSSWLDKKDILVVTAQLVVDALKNDEIKVEDFTLMVFDECHNANASHPYAQIMNEYMDLKLDESVDRQKLPFVVGLTASVGVGRANLEDENKYIQKMMANLDAEELSTVKKCLPELTEHAIVVEQETISTVERKKNYFGETLVVMMDTIESYMRNSSYASLLPDNGSILKGPTDKGSDTYTKWISKLLRETAKINRQDARRYFETCRLYLDLYNKVLTIYEDARVEDAILYLEQYLKRINEELKPDATDDKMLKIYQEGNRILAACVGNVYHINPKLIALRDIIFKLYKEKPDSRMIIFIKTREVVQAIENWMKDTDGLSYLNPVKFVCTHATGEKGGMTKMEQDGILKKFRTGKHKIILATSVAEEGLDIQTCNLIIRYDHAPNEIAIIQARGRNRAEGSKMVAVASEKRISVEKEEINLISETKMNDAILKVQQKLSRNKVQFLEDVEKIQRSEKKKRDLEKLSRKIGTKQRNSEFVLRCGKCSRYICISSDIKKIQNIHHAVINDDVRNSITTEKSETKRIRIDAYTTCVVGKVKCKNCEKELGNVIIHQGAEFPILKIDKLLVADSAGKTTVFKKWKSVPFCPDPMINEDLEFRLQGQPYVLD
ncbi:interferon-induced helicase C domain-containing protein 1-like isoform X1 [Mytilus californianus]|uniref:interferon-induced helicase C domain-containing protein 1-like isoform X1 n=1 Tax=Mytilus californianus TaxID=6549 RepID=UPI00224504D0|nr:interferon-induced helicase C domain-containing protein 1-like isoform X1 [Mytilus californianus]